MVVVESLLANVFFFVFPKARSTTHPKPESKARKIAMAVARSL